MEISGVAPNFREVLTFYNPKSFLFISLAEHKPRIKTDQHLLGVIALFISFGFSFRFFRICPISTYLYPSLNCDDFLCRIDFIYVPKTLMLPYQGICCDQSGMEFCIAFLIFRIYRKYFVCSRLTFP